MRFFTEDILENYEKFREACELNYIEYLKAKKRLPKKFIKIYEQTGRFDDDPVPYISIVSQYSRFTHGINNAPPSILRMVIVDYDDRDLAWEIIISDIKEMSSRWFVLPGNLRIDCIDHDEIIIEDEKHISWEMLFVGGLDLKVVFRNISIRQLEKDELEIYRLPIKKPRKACEDTK